MQIAISIPKFDEDAIVIVQAQERGFRWRWTFRATRKSYTIALAAAGHPEDMNLPGFGFHGLTGFNPKRYAVSVSGNWRITFAFDGEDAVDVDLEDYH